MNSKKIKFIAIFSIFLFITLGCTSRMLIDYEGVDTSTLQVVSLQEEKLYSVIYSDNFDCYGVKYLSQAEEFNEKTFKIKDRDFLTFEYQFYRGSYGVGVDGTTVSAQLCGGIYTLPSAGFNTRVKLSKNQSICSVEFFQQSKNSSDRTWVPVQAIVKRTKTIPQGLTADKEGPHCSADNNYRGSSLLKVPRGK